MEIDLITDAKYYIKYKVNMIIFFITYADWIFFPFYWFMTK